jgi:putative DNA primase/helicase
MWKWAKKSETAAAINAMVKLARGLSGIETDHNDLDSDPWLLNVLNGTVDLRTGQLREHDPDDLLTMRAPVVYDPDAQAPLWQKCVERWQPATDRRVLIQRAVRAGITGKPVERFFVNLGGGGNGKSKFFDTIGHILGPYFAVPDHSLLIKQRFEPHEEVKANLFRTRMVVGAETDEDATLADSKIKDLTGGGILQASRKFEHRFKFGQTWTMFMHTNHRPKVRDLTDGMWRRTRLIPWDVTITEAEKDEHLLDKLLREASGILNWLIGGCLDWQHNGWNEPESVRVATKDWQGEENTYERWLADCATVSETCYETAAALYESYTLWCSETNSDVMSAKAFGTELAKRFDSTRKRVHGKQTRVWMGIGLRADQPDDSDPPSGHPDPQTLDESAGRSYV